MSIKRGDNFDSVAGNLVDKAVVAVGYRRIHFVLPEGAVRTARPDRGAIHGKVPGTRFGSRKARGRGTRRRPRTLDLYGVQGPAERLVPPVPSGAFVCAAQRPVGVGPSGLRRPAGVCATGSPPAALAAIRMPTR